MALALYPGCSLTGSSREYNESVTALLDAFSIAYQEVPDWNCCGATAAHNLNRELSLSLPARIIDSAARHGFSEILVPCAACFNRLKTTQHELTGHPEVKSRIDEILGRELQVSIPVINVVEAIGKYILPGLADRVTHPFDKKAACYYGCLLVRPHYRVEFDREEDPQTMETVLRVLGSKPIEWAFKTECCGAGHTVSNTPVVARLSGKILTDALDREAEVVVVACPMCHSNLDMRRPAIEKTLGKRIDIPVIYLTQAIGLALGMDKKKLGLHRHFVPAMTL